MRTRVVVAAALAGVLVAPVGAQAAGKRPSLDTSFNVTGVVIEDFGPGDTVVDMAVQADGKIVAVGPGDGNFNVLRRLADGSGDESFGSSWGGRVTTDVEPSTYGETPRSLALLPDGRIAVGGEVSRDGHSVGVVVFYAADGSVQSIIYPDLGPRVASSRVVAMSARPGGKLLLALHAATGDGSDPPVLARLLADGTLDATFGVGGVARADIGGRDFDQPSGMAVAPDGRILVGGTTGWWSTLPEPTSDVTLARFTANGALDTSFGTGGRVNRDITGPDAIDGGGVPSVTADGRILVTVWTQQGDTRRTGLLRYLPNGRPDRSFDRDGLTMTSFESLNSPVTGPGGRITVTGRSGGDLLLAEFGADGRLLWTKPTDVNGGLEDGHVLLARPGGKLLVGGQAEGESFAIFRFNR
ncbi:hypothetical protein AB0J83_40620 [Actinoplanes sp. NPDC049596]|uniref:hypothetical protein n=1 Tax=unclassified Actinoplanes TaxID=2626549 RepID=UPI0034142569